MVTIKDVAKEAGVAISTVSNVLNGVDTVSEEKKKLVLEAAEKLKYVPNMNAKLLKSSRKNTIGLFLTSVQGDIHRMLLQSIHLQCKFKGYMLNIYISNENTSEEIYRMIISSGVEGAIVFNEQLQDEYIELLAQTKIPLVFIDREYEGEGMSSVTIDNTEGATLAVEYLVKQGNRRIGYIHGVTCRDDDERFNAYLNILAKYNLPVDEKIILRGYFEEAVAYSEMRVLLLHKIQMPDAFFCANDEMAIGCIRAASEFGYRVPEILSVIGFDDIGSASYNNPALTTIHNPVTELGTLGVTELIRLMTAGSPIQGRIMKLKPSLVVRDSCKFKI